MSRPDERGQPRLCLECPAELRGRQETFCSRRCGNRARQRHRRQRLALEALGPGERRLLEAVCDPDYFCEGDVPDDGDCAQAVYTIRIQRPDGYTLCHAVQGGIRLHAISHESVAIDACGPRDIVEAFAETEARTQQWARRKLCPVGQDDEGEVFTLRPADSDGRLSRGNHHKAKRNGACAKTDALIPTDLRQAEYRRRHLEGFWVEITFDQPRAVATAQPPKTKGTKKRMITSN